MIKKISIYFLFLLVFLVYAEEQKLPVIANAEKLKSVKGKKIIWQKDEAEMVLIPASDTIKVFWMDTTEVTVGQFNKFLKSSGYKPEKFINWNDVSKYSSTDKHPMVYVSWHDAVAYAKWVGKRLPTEKEWVLAARGGLVDKDFSWGNDISLASDYANYQGTDGKDKWDETTAPVGSFKPNDYGLHDMAGNVYEWCQDWSDEMQIFRVLRGGSWHYDIRFLRVALRFNDYPTDRDYDIGFRCVSGLD